MLVGRYVPRDAPLETIADLIRTCFDLFPGVADDIVTIWQMVWVPKYAYIRVEGFEGVLGMVGIN